jgi:hypothetical protein
MSINSLPSRFLEEIFPQCGKHRATMGGKHRATAGGKHRAAMTGKHRATITGKVYPGQ